MRNKPPKRGRDSDEYGAPFDHEDDISHNASPDDMERQEFGFALPETQIRGLALIDELLRITQRSDPRFQYLLLLRHQVETDEKQFEEAQEMIQQYDDAYNK